MNFDDIGDHSADVSVQSERLESGRNKRCTGLSGSEIYIPQQLLSEIYLPRRVTELR